jgi:uncharacterized protein YndB with AHSA1/START domain
MPDPDPATAPIVKQLRIAAPPSLVWRVLTVPVQIAAWMSDEALAVTADWRAGGAITLQGVLHGLPFENRGTITGFVPERLFEYRYWSSLSAARLTDLPQHRTTVRFELAPVPAGTALTLRLSDFREPSIRPHADMYWGPTLQIIKRHAEAAPA